jgi:hypothetical protein
MTQPERLLEQSMHFFPLSMTEHNVKLLTMNLHVCWNLKSSMCTSKLQCRLILPVSSQA